MGWRYKNSRTAIMNFAVEILKNELNTKIPMGKREQAIKDIADDLRKSLKQVEVIDTQKKPVEHMTGGWEL